MNVDKTIMKKSIIMTYANEKNTRYNNIDPTAPNAALKQYAQAINSIQLEIANSTVTEEISVLTDNR